jgi:hypothetical protein
MLEAKISDFRIYATALSDNDVVDLYEVAASAVNYNSLLAYEFIEETDTSILKTGQVNNPAFTECINLAPKIIGNDNTRLFNGEPSLKLTGNTTAAEITHPIGQAYLTTGHIYYGAYHAYQTVQ